MRVTAPLLALLCLLLAPPARAAVRLALRPTPTPQGNARGAGDILERGRRAYTDPIWVSAPGSEVRQESQQR
jgi:hypothetical protein